MTGELRMVDPGDCYPPHIDDPWKTDKLFWSLWLWGWQLHQPILVGYYLNETIQLLSGSHRFAAALQLKIEIPVQVYSYEDIKEAWGTELWEKIMSPMSYGEFLNARANGATSSIRSSSSNKR